jgi:hypothetical protein
MLETAIFPSRHNIIGPKGILESPHQGQFRYPAYQDSFRKTDKFLPWQVMWQLQSPTKKAGPWLTLPS